MLLRFVLTDIQRYWGYLVVLALYNGVETEEYIDLIPILHNLCIEPSEFLKNIKEVNIRYD